MLQYPARVHASARRAAGCRCWASWSPRSLPALGGPRQLGRGARVRQQAELGKATLFREGGKEEELAAGAAEILVLFFLTHP